MLLIIFYVKTCIEFLQKLPYFNFFITGKRHWKVTDKILTVLLINYKSIFKVLLVFSRLNLKVLFTDLRVIWNLRSKIGLNVKTKISP